MAANSQRQRRCQRNPKKRSRGCGSNVEQWFEARAAEDPCALFANATDARTMLSHHPLAAALACSRASLIWRGARALRPTFLEACFRCHDYSFGSCVVDVRRMMYVMMYSSDEAYLAMQRTARFNVNTLVAS